MARKKREYTDTEMYHVIIRGNNKQNLFYDNNDRYHFLKKLRQYSEKDGITIFAYCLMSNHVHLLVGKANNSLSKFIQRLSISYVRRYNYKYDCTGHLFQGRFKSEPVKSTEQFKATYRYILQNPSKSGLGRFDQYQWNSYKLFISNGNSFIEKKVAIDFFGGKNNLLEYISIPNNDTLLEYENKPVYNDFKCLSFLNNLFNSSNPHFIIQLPISIQKKALQKLKKSGFSINQISRVTGISRYIIKTA